MCWWFPRSCYEDDDTYDAGWDWQDPNAFANYYGIPLFSPWGADSHLGVDVTNYSHPTADGWRLYAKRLTCVDMGVQCASGDNISGNVNDGPMPYFVLYNVHSGLLRTFVYINMEKYNPDQQLLANFGVVRRGPYADDLDYATDLFANALGQALSEDPQEATPMVYVTPAVFGKWVVIDQYLSYVPDKAIGDGLMFDLRFDAVSQTSIEVGGDLSLTKTEVVAPDGGLQAVWDARDKIAEGFGGPASWVTGLGKKADRLQKQSSAWAQSLGESLASISETVAPLTGYVGAAIAGYNIFSAFTDGTSGHTSSEFYEGQIELSGTLSVTNPVDFLLFGVHQSDHAVVSNRSTLDFPGRLGVWSLRAPPAVTAYLDGVDIGPIDLRSLLNINPDSRMRLARLEASMLLDFNEYVACPTSAGRFEDLEGVFGGGEPDFQVMIQNSYIVSMCSRATVLETTSANFKGNGANDDAPMFELVEIGDVEATSTGEVSTSGDGLSPIDFPARLTFVAARSPGTRVRAITRSSVVNALRPFRLWATWEPHIYVGRGDVFNGYTWARAQEDGHIAALQEAYLQLYTRFHHVDDPTIYHEEIRTFRAEIVRRPCTLNEYEALSNDPEPPPVCTN